MEPIIGIDWGNETSSVVILSDMPDPSQRGKDLVHTMQLLSADLISIKLEDGEGIIAPNRNGSGEKRLHGIKRMLLSPDSMPLQDELLYPCLKDLPKPNVTWDVLKDVPVEKLCAAYFRGLWNHLLTSQSPARAVCTIPGYIQAEKRQALHAIHEQSAPVPVELISESEATAAYLSYYRQMKPGQRAALVNVGAGNCWGAIALFGKAGTFEILAEVGSPLLGGYELDRYLAILIQSKLLSDNLEIGLDSAPGTAIFDRLMNEANAIKCEMRHASQNIDVLLPFLLLTPDGHPKHYRLSITLQDLRDGLAVPFEAIRSVCQQALQESGLTIYDIDSVVLVGEQTRLPPLIAMIGAPSSAGGVFGRMPLFMLGKLELAAGAALASAGRVGTKAAPVRISDQTKVSIPSLLRTMPPDIWDPVVSILLLHPEAKSFSPQLLVKIAQISKNVSFDKAIEIYRNYGEGGLDEWINTGQIKQDRSFFRWLNNS